LLAYLQRVRLLACLRLASWKILLLVLQKVLLPYPQRVWLPARLQRVQLAWWKTFLLHTSVFQKLLLLYLQRVRLPTRLQCVQLGP
jgi:hypothetical protein